MKLEPCKHFVGQLQVNILSSVFHTSAHSFTNRKQHHLTSWTPQSSGIILTVDFCTKSSGDDFTLYTMPTFKLIHTFWTHWSSFRVPVTSFYTCQIPVFPFTYFPWRCILHILSKTDNQEHCAKKYARNRERMIMSLKKGQQTLHSPVQIFYLILLFSPY